MILVDSKSFGTDVYIDSQKHLWVFEHKLLKSSFEEIGEAMLSGQPLEISVLWDNHWEERVLATVSVQSKRIVFRQIGPTTIVEPHRKPIYDESFEPGETVRLTRAALGHDPERNRTYRLEKHRVGEVVECDPGRDCAIVRIALPDASRQVDVQIGITALDKMISHP